MAVTINTGTTAPTAVLIAGNEENVKGQFLYICEQIADGAPTVSNSTIIGTAITTNGAIFTGGPTGIDFAATVVVSGFVSYSLGPTGTAGDIFLSLRTGL
jgi:hypothetical protein